MWFKVDDGFWCHRKVMRLPGVRRLLTAGAWVIAGSWASDQLSDGVIMQADLPAIFPGVPARLIRTAVEGLVESHLWEPIPGGWQFHDWQQCQPTREAVMQRLAQDRERKLKQRRSKDGRFLTIVAPDTSQNG